MTSRIVPCAALAAIACCTLLTLAPASAQDWIHEWDFDFSVAPHANMSGNDGWISGCSDDHWDSQSFADAREVNPTTDEGGGLWASDDYISNHLCQEEEGPWGDLSFGAQILVMDDDALGMVIRKSGPATFYLFLMTEHLRPSMGEGGDGGQGSGAFLYRVEDGIADVPETNNNAHYRVDGGQNYGYQRIRLEMIGDTLTAYYSAQESGALDEGDIVLEYTDPDPLPAGHVGFYSYDMGGGDGGLGFRDPVVELADSDGDGVPNDEDCAIDDADSYPGADEDCDDGVDNDCDGDVDGDDADCNGGDDDDSAGDDDVSGDDDGGPTIVGGGDCDCRVAGSMNATGPLSALALALFLAVYRLRRRV